MCCVCCMLGWRCVRTLEVCVPRLRHTPPASPTCWRTGKCAGLSVKLHRSALFPLRKLPGSRVGFSRMEMRAAVKPWGWAAHLPPAPCPCPGKQKSQAHRYARRGYHAWIIIDQVAIVRCMLCGALNNAVFFPPTPHYLCYLLTHSCFDMLLYYV